MPRVRTRYFAMLREDTGVREEELELPEGSTLTDFIEFLVEKYEGLRRVLFDEKGEFREGFMVAHNAETVPRIKLGSRKLKDGDEIVILPPIGGG